MYGVDYSYKGDYECAVSITRIRMITNVRYRLLVRVTRCRGKAISMKNHECVSVALVIQHAKCMRCIILSSVASPALPHFSTLFHKRHDFRKKKKKVTLHKMRVLIFCTIFV
jgi:hypothetical protein